MTRHSGALRAIALFVATATIAACSGGSQPGVTPSIGGAAAVSAFPFVSGGSGTGKIKHVVIIIQENRTLDNLFYEYPGADTVKDGKTSTGAMIPLRPASLAVPIPYVMDHSATAMYVACDAKGAVPGSDCRNDGFDRIKGNYCGFYSGSTAQRLDGPRGVIREAESTACPSPPINYVYVPHSDSKPYFDMAHEWVLADHNFQSHLDESFIGHQYLIAAQADASVNLPNLAWGCGSSSSASARADTSVVDASGLYPTPQPIPPSKAGLDVVERLNANRTFGPWQSSCFDYKTLADELDKANLTWRFYTSKYGAPSSDEGSFWSAYQAVRHIYKSKEWTTNVIKCCTPQTKFITDVAAGTLANVTWITPICSNSDHANCGGGFGPSWVSTLVDAVGKSKFWDSTAIFVVWDDWGGLYDHVPPPYRDFDGLGFRVPLLIISPYAKKDYVSHVQYESAGILTFTEDVFGLGRLSAADTRATSPAADCFDFMQTPRKFVPIVAPKSADFFLHDQAVDRRAPDFE